MSAFVCKYFTDVSPSSSHTHQGTCDWDAALQHFTPPSDPPPESPRRTTHPPPFASLPLSSPSFCQLFTTADPGRSFPPPRPCFWEVPRTRLSVTCGDPEMITPDEPWTCAMITTDSYSTEQPVILQLGAVSAVARLNRVCCTDPHCERLSCSGATAHGHAHCNAH